jgi:hypothetical protein
VAALLWAAAGSGTDAADLPPASSNVQTAALVRRIGAVFAEESRGVVGFRSHALVQTSPHFARPDQIDEAWVVDVDGRAVNVRGGDAAGPAAAEAAVHQPFDPRYVAEYRFLPAPCTGCAAGSVALAYDTDAHDVAHGHGLIVIDERSARVLRVTVQPFVVPRPARDGTITTTWGSTAAGWLPVAATGTFSGRIGPFGGHATLTQRFTDHKRYADLAAAQNDPAAR